ESHHNYVHNAALSPDGLYLAVAGSDGLKVFDGAPGREVARYRLATALAVAFSPDGKHLAAVGQLGVALWDRATGRPLEPLPWMELAAERGGLFASKPVPFCLAFSADSRYLAV